jgi:serine O-acetyltransferase
MTSFDIGDLVQGLRAARGEWRDAQGRAREAGGRELPSPQALERVIEQLKGALFPMRLGPADLRNDTEDFYVGHTLDAALRALQAQVLLEVRHAARHAEGGADDAPDRAATQVRAFAQSLPDIRRVLDTDVLAAWQGDPAARSVDEVLLCYPGVLAMIHHRLAHRLYQLGLPLLARIVAEIAHSRTGIDIHPGATIGRGFFIDHGTGVVIGETAVIGERVRLYQNVTLGAKRFPVAKDGHLAKGLPRHPVVEDDVVIYAGATVLGRVTIGKGAVIGGNVWVTHDVPPGGSVAQARNDEGKGVS